MIGGGYDDLMVLLGRAAALDTESEERWQIVRGLHARADREAFDAAVRLAGSADLAERLLGIEVLGQIGYAAERPFREETVPILIAACEDDRPEVLDSAITALGHVRDQRGLAAVLRHAGHAGDEVRYAVACALPSVAADPPQPEVIAALIRLTADSDSEVRDWATFGLGRQMDADNEEIRQALAVRLDDPDDETAAEALFGLAKRHDPRALPVLLTWLEDDPTDLVVEAAAALADPAVLPALLRLRETGPDGEPSAVLADAIKACDTCLNGD